MHWDIHCQLVQIKIELNFTNPTPESSQIWSTKSLELSCRFFTLICGCDDPNNLDLLIYVVAAPHEKPHRGILIEDTDPL